MIHHYVPRHNPKSILSPHSGALPASCSGNHLNHKSLTSRLQARPNHAKYTKNILRADPYLSSILLESSHRLRAIPSFSRQSAFSDSYHLRGIASSSSHTSFFRADRLLGATPSSSSCAFFVDLAHVQALACSLSSPILEFPTSLKLSHLGTPSHLLMRQHLL